MIVALSSRSEANSSVSVVEKEFNSSSDASIFLLLQPSTKSIGCVLRSGIIVERV